MKRWIWLSWVLVLGMGCEAPTAADMNPAEEDRGSPAAAPATDSAPSESRIARKAGPLERQCLKQDDCPEGLVCVAEGVRRLVCKEHEPAPPRTGPGGRPVPPVGLLDFDPSAGQGGSR
jgi:hypothetical protein